MPFTAKTGDAATANAPCGWTIRTGLPLGSASRAGKRYFFRRRRSICLLSKMGEKTRPRTSSRLVGFVTRTEHLTSPLAGLTSGFGKGQKGAALGAARVRVQRILVAAQRQFLGGGLSLLGGHDERHRIGAFGRTTDAQPESGGLNVVNDVVAFAPCQRPNAQRSVVVDVDRNPARFEVLEVFVEVQFHTIAAPVEVPLYAFCGAVAVPTGCYRKTPESP
jgi:hypothetical protein